MAIDITAIQESFRRRSGQEASTAAIPGGAPAANAPVPGNPLTTAPGAPAPGGAPQPPQSASGEGIKQLGNSLPNEANVITKALIKRQQKLGESGM